MNEQLEKFAKQAPLLKSYDYPDLRLVDDDQLARFAELVRQDEREACAKLCDDLQLTDLAIRDWADGTYDCAKAIRARGNHDTER
jgi:hypothetical protein